MFPKTTKFKLYVFDTIALANASAIQFGYGTIIQIANDNTRFKLGGGISVSFDTPSAPTTKTFPQLPWINSQPSLSNAYLAPTTRTLTAAQLSQRYIKTTSAAATTLTLPTAALLGAALAATEGTELSFTIDNATGANTVTVALGAGITAGTGALTGSGSLTVPAGQFAKFTIIFITPTTALLYRTL